MSVDKQKEWETQAAFKALKFALTGTRLKWL